ncbi:VAN3-binding protein, partial [Primulina huaijiensis]|uniref:VAN3-binding protein n=1 Tax=Primulina huaijiensis TaxID=1492673 RepID=UPI003CC730B3
IAHNYPFHQQLTKLQTNTPKSKFHQVFVFILAKTSREKNLHGFLPYAVSENPQGTKCRLDKLENIEEDTAADWLPVTCPLPETPTESMEFLARSWSLSAVELSKVLCDMHDAKKLANEPPTCPRNEAPQADHGSSLLSQNQPLLVSESPPVSPRGSADVLELFLLHQSRNLELLSYQQLIKNGGLYQSIMKKKTMGRWIKDQKERKRQENRAHNAQLHAAVSVAGVAAAVAALTASLVTTPEKSSTKHKKSSITSTAIASAAALVASHCIEIAGEMGADHGQILSAVNSAINSRTNGDIMTLTAGAATALRGVATLRTRLCKEHGTAPVALTEENARSSKDSNISAALSFATKGGELLKRTRKGDLHWKQVSFNINSNCQIVAKMKSKHMGGTFMKKKKCIVSGIYSDVPAWPGRDTEGKEKMAYFSLQTADRIIEFECRNKEDKQMWIEGIQSLLRMNMNMK